MSECPICSFAVKASMDSWTEKSFSKSITAGVDFMDNVAAQIADYKFEVKQAMLLKILEGIFSMTTTGATVRAKAAKEFVEKHTFDITANEGEAAMVGATTLNKATVHLLRRRLLNWSLRTVCIVFFAKCQIVISFVYNVEKLCNRINSNRFGHSLFEK